LIDPTATYASILPGSHVWIKYNSPLPLSIESTTPDADATIVQSYDGDCYYITHEPYEDQNNNLQMQLKFTGSNTSLYAYYTVSKTVDPSEPIAVTGAAVSAVQCGEDGLYRHLDWLPVGSFQACSSGTSFNYIKYPPYNTTVELILCKTSVSEPPYFVNGKSWAQITNGGSFIFSG
tara:strand:- start:85 stop:615 length:531 start_codon:yes stop_codon:yes gene_type:complete